MVAAANMVEVAALVGDTARATMLAALMSGQSLTGSELAYIAHVSRPTASEHLAKLSRRGCSASPGNAASIITALLRRWSRTCSKASRQSRRSKYRRGINRAQCATMPCAFARTCYDHLAGQIAVAIADAL